MNISSEGLVKAVVGRHVVIMRFTRMQGEPEGLLEEGHINPEEETSCCGNREDKDGVKLNKMSVQKTTRIKKCHLLRLKYFRSFNANETLISKTKDKT